MLAIVLSILLFAAILSFLQHIIMRIRLTKAEPSRDKLVWWGRGSGEVTAMYEELFPDSYMPLLCQFAFWLVLALASVILAGVLWKSH